MNDSPFCGHIKFFYVVYQFSLSISRSLFCYQQNIRLFHKFFSLIRPSRTRQVFAVATVSQKFYEH